MKKENFELEKLEYEEVEELFDEEYDTWQKEELQRQDDYFDNHADEMYEQYAQDYYQSLEDKNMFVLIYNTSTVREYIAPGTNVHKVEHLKNNKVVSISYYKQYNNKKEN